MSDLMKKVLAGAAAVMLVASFGLLAGCGGGGNYTDGTYEAMGEGGKEGEVGVIVTVTDGKISDIEFGENNETDAMAAKVEDEVFPAIIDAQSTDVDAASGATLTSEAVKDGVNKALEQAK